MAQVNTGLDNNSPQAIDRSYGALSFGSTVPYVSTNAANAAVPGYFRHIGKTVLIDSGGGPVEYWWKSGIADINLEQKIVTPAAEWQPYQVLLTEDGSFSIPQNSLLDMIVIVPTVGFNLKIGTSAGAEDLQLGLPMIANQANVSVLIVPAWGSDQLIYFSGIPASTTFLLYMRSLIPSNP